MKFIIIFVLLCSTAFAGEVATDCPAMSSSREKILKDSATKKSKSSGARVVSQ